MPVYPVDVFFTGLMLICLDGHSSCPAGDYKDKENTAWVLKAVKDYDKPCGWDKSYDTTLELKFSPGHFEHTDYIKVCEESDPVKCKLPTGDICLELKPEPKEQQYLTGSLDKLPRLDQEVDWRFNGLRTDRLRNPRYVSTRIHFPTGGIGPGPDWCNGYGWPEWGRSNGDTFGNLPRTLSDALKVRYSAVDTLTVSDCTTKKELIVLRPQMANAKATIRNWANLSSEDPVKNRDILAYLLYYNRLAYWGIWGECFDRKCSILLSCERTYHDKPCHCVDGDCAADTTYWPPMLGPRH